MKNLFKFIALIGAVSVLSGCAELELASHVAKKAQPTSQGNFKVGKPYKVEGKTYVPEESYALTETGIASWYGPGFQGKRTANGEPFDTNELTAAHRTLQLPSLVRVTNLENGRSVIVRVNDRGPFKRGRIMDVSQKAARLLGFEGAGTAKVKIQVLDIESRKIADAAKAGRSTRGAEVALNQGHENHPALQNAVYNPAQAPSAQNASYSQAPVERLALGDAGVPGHVSHGEFFPDPVVSHLPVSPTGIYVQTGSFGNQANAQALASKLASVGPSHVYPALVNGRQFFRVRIGPVSGVEQADAMLSRVVEKGYKESIIMVE